MACASRVQRRNVIARQRTDGWGSVIVTTDNWRVRPHFRSLEEILANPDFVSQATATARRDARGTRLALILQSARPLVADLTAAERPLDVLNVPLEAGASPASTFTTISTLFFVPWAHGDCSNRMMELQRTGEVLRPGSSPVAALYEAIALDVQTRESSQSSHVAVDLQQRKLEITLGEYTRSLTGWMRAVLG